MNVLDQMIACIKHKHVFIQTHNFPDPDAIASAFGLQQLFAQKGIESTICYKGRIDRSSSARMVEELSIRIVELEEMEDMKEDAEIVLVDSQKGNANTIDLPGSEILCVDHHPTFEKAEYEYSDIRPEVGACASIIASYYFENEIEMDVRVATALIYGIKVDTANLTRGVSDLDLTMFYQIYHKANMDLIKRLEMNVLKMQDLNAYARAISTIRICGRICFANTGANCPEPLIASISDFMLALDEISMSVVYSLKADGIKISVRSANIRLNAGKITNEALRGIGNGGGHENMAGGFIPYRFEPALPLDQRKEKLNDLFNQIQKRFLDTMPGIEN